MFRQITGQIDLRLGQIVYISVVCNISFSWLLPLDGFYFIFLCRVYCVTMKTIYCLLLGKRSVGIEITTQFFEAQLDWGCRILLLQKGHPLRLMAWAACGLFPVLCSRTSDFHFAARTFLDFSNSLSLSMLKGYFFSLNLKYRCILGSKLEIVAGSYSSPFFLHAL